MNQEEIIKILKSGGIGVLPTDTQYGLVTQALNETAVEKAYQLRRRSPDKPFIILISVVDDLKLFGIDIDNKTSQFLHKIWPNSVSVILSVTSNDFAYLHRGTNSLAFRIPNNPDLLTILKETGPLIAPSANIEGHPYAKTITEAKNYFGDSIDFYEDKGEVESNPSTLIKIGEEGVEVLRQGTFPTLNLSNNLSNVIK